MVQRYETLSRHTIRLSPILTDDVDSMMELLIVSHLTRLGKHIKSIDKEISSHRILILKVWCGISIHNFH